MKSRNLIILIISTIALLCAAFFVMGAGEDTKTFLEKEAGVSAYTNVGQVDLAEAKKIYRTVEREEEEYIVGSVAIPDYSESQDPHVYVSKDGWVVGYYLKDDPASKMMDWVSYDKTGAVSTKLEAALKLMCDQLGKLLPDVKYYDFRYPDANELMIIADKDGEFKVKIPDDITVYERSWWRLDGQIFIKIDGNTVVPKDGYCGKLTPIQLSQGVFHTIEGYQSGRSSVWNQGPFGIALVYREP